MTLVWNTSIVSILLLMVSTLENTNLINHLEANSIGANELCAVVSGDIWMPLLFFTSQRLPCNLSMWNVTTLMRSSSLLFFLFSWPLQYFRRQCGQSCNASNGLRLCRYEWSSGWICEQTENHIPTRIRCIFIRHIGVRREHSTGYKIIHIPYELSHRCKN